MDEDRRPYSSDTALLRTGRDHATGQVRQGRVLVQVNSSVWKKQSREHPHRLTGMLATFREAKEGRIYRRRGNRRVMWRGQQRSRGT